MRLSRVFCLTAIALLVGACQGELKLLGGSSLLDLGQPASGDLTQPAADAVSFRQVNADMDQPALGARELPPPATPGPCPRAS